MEFRPSEDQQDIVDLIRDLLADRSGPMAVRAAIASEAGYDERLWTALGDEVGLTGIAIPEAYGGVGLGPVEAQLILIELGVALAPSPFLGSAVVAARALLLAEDTDASERLLPGIASGASIATLAWADAHGRWGTDGGSVRADTGRLTGVTTLVLDGMAAGIVLVVADDDDGPALYEVTDETGLDRIPTPALDPGLRFATLRFAGVPARRIAGSAGALLGRIRDEAEVAVTALQVGAAQRGLDMTVEYAKQRHQFGRAIGSFQALKHRMADMLVATETARTLSWHAAWCAQGGNGLPEAAATAKAWCSDALDLVAAETVQLHGGIAITWEHDAQLVFKRAHATGQLFGSSSDARARLAAGL